VVVGNGGATGKLSSNGAYDLVIDTNSGTNAGSITLEDAANGDITLACNGTGDIECSSDVKTSTTKKVHQKGAFLMSSTHQALFMGL